NSLSTIPYSIDSRLPNPRRSCPPPSYLLAVTAAVFAARRFLQNRIPKTKRAKRAAIPTPIKAPATLELTAPTLVVVSVGFFRLMHSHILLYLCQEPLLRRWSRLKMRRSQYELYRNQSESRFRTDHRHDHDLSLASFKRNLRDGYA